MATGTHYAFDHTADLIGNGTFNFDTHVFKVVACSTAPVSTNTIETDLTKTTGLSSNVITLAGAAPWQTTTTNDARFNKDNVTFTAVSAATIKAFAVYDDDPTSPLVDPLVSWGHPNAGAVATGVVLAAGEKLEFQWDASGLLTLTVT